MKISLNWIKEYVSLPADLTMEKIAYDLTMATVEVEGWEDMKARFDKIVVGNILDLEKHPNADKLTICRVDVGAANGGVKDIVCGGINLRKGMKVAVSLPGAKVRWHGEGDLVEVKVAKVRGAESFGMICASSEIGLYDLFPFDLEKEDGTIVDLSDFDADVGTNLAVALGIDDVILEIDNKSLTNRPDLWGHYGIARELSAFYGVPLVQIAPCEMSKNLPKIEITIADAQKSPRYIGVQIEGLEVKPSPFDIQTRLWRVGLRPINAIVDITNCVMLATGQPTHAFDSEKIEGHITVRRANDGEKLLLLDDRELTLCTDDLVIADDAGAVALAGVMGGKRDSVLPETNKIILEIANFDALGVRRTASRYDARTDAAIRFEKGIDPQRADITLPHVMQLFAAIYPEMKVTGFRDNYAQFLERKKIDVSLNWLEQRLGKRIANDDIARVLGHLGFETTFENDTLRVTVPSWRSTGDVSIPDDIMEELARMHGYENFAAAPIVTAFTDSITQPIIDIDRRIREFLAYRVGMREIFTYPWMKDEFATAILGMDAGGKIPSTSTQNMASRERESTRDVSAVSLSAPPSPDEKFLRPSLLPNICRAIAGNVRYYNEFAIFESAQVFLPGDFVVTHDKREKLPVQRRNVAGAFVGGGGGADVSTLFRRAKGALEALSRNIHAKPLDFKRVIPPTWADETVWLDIYNEAGRIGHFGLLAKKAALACGIKNHSVVLFELDIDALTPLSSRDNKYEHLPAFPVNEYDISLLFDAAKKWDEISAVVLEKKGEGNILRGVSFVDEYCGKQIPDGKKSVTLRMTLGSSEKTLTSNEIENFANSVVKRLTKQLGAEARGK
ncbi:MAG: phenylalanine--tRNA ligase subunit beta [Defluviitaleaceae bacterium]|nr:phenylalanine--tRNA ligase subunit beta [Defluviitaleaceae bacterium]